MNGFFFSTRFGVKMPSQFVTVPTQFNTSIDIPAGKKVVVGKAGAGGDHAIFLVVEAAVAK